MFFLLSCFIKFIILLSMCFISEIISYSEEDEPYREYTQPTAKLKHDYGNVSTKLIIFDTDKTIWPFITTNNEICPPFTKKPGDIIIDKNGKTYKPFPETKNVFFRAKQLGHKIGIIAQNPDCSVINNLIDLFEFGKYVDYRACFVGPKKDLVRKLQQVSNFSVDDILYLDDEHDDIPSVMDLDVTALMISEEGLVWDDVSRGLAVFTFVGPWRGKKDSYENTESYEGLK